MFKSSSCLNQPQIPQARGFKKRPKIKKISKSYQLACRFESLTLRTLPASALCSQSSERPVAASPVDCTPSPWPRAEPPQLPSNPPTLRHCVTPSGAVTHGVGVSVSVSIPGPLAGCGGRRRTGSGRAAANLVWTDGNGRSSCCQSVGPTNKSGRSIWIRCGGMIEVYGGVAMCQAL